jgi:hypothetical protein
MRLKSIIENMIYEKEYSLKDIQKALDAGKSVTCAVDFGGMIDIMATIEDVQDDILSIYTQFDDEGEVTFDEISGVEIN